MLYVELRNLRALREARWITQVELARAADLTVNTVSKIERGHRAQMKTVRRLSRALGVQPEELVGRPDQKMRAIS